MIKKVKELLVIPRTTYHTSVSTTVVVNTVVILGSVVALPSKGAGLVTMVAGLIELRKQARSVPL